MIGIAALIKTAYDTQFANYFAAGTAASPYSYTPIPVRVRLYLESAILISIGVCFVVSASILSKNQTGKAIPWAIAGPVSGIMIHMLTRFLKTNGY